MLRKFQKIAFTAFILLSAALAYLGYQALRNKKAPAVKAITVIPDNCKLLFTFNNFSEFSNGLKNKSLLWQELSEISALKNFEKQFSRYDSIVITNEFLEELLNDNPVHFALYDQKTFLIAFNLKERADEKKIREYLSTGFKNLSYDLKNGVICASNSKELINIAFNVSSAKLVNNQLFKKFISETNYKGTSLYVNLPNEFIPSSAISEISLKPENIVFNGVSYRDTLKFYGDATAEPISSYDMLKYVPLVCNEFEIMSIKARYEEKSEWWKQINDDALFNAEKQFKECLGNYQIVLRLPSGSKALITEISDTARFRELIPFMADSAGEATAKKLKNTGNFVGSTFPFLKEPEPQYFMVIDDQFIVTENESDAQIFINSHFNQTSILNNADFASYASRNFDLDFHYLCYKAINTMQKKNIPLNDYFNEKEKEHLKNLSHYSITGTHKGNFFNFRLNLKYFQENVSSEPNVLWTLNADSTIITQPYSFTNHLTNAKEITYQLSDKSLLLQSATGKILWTKKLSEEIRSEIFTVDAFKNGKNQLLFNTDNFIHLIDRNGNYVQGYPVRLPAKATNKLTVFDYGKTRDYRLFIACGDNRIYNYSVWGIKQEGFKTFPVLSEVVLPLKYCKVGLSDYLVTADVKGRIYALSRKGEGRIDFKNKILENTVTFEMDCGNSLVNTQLLYYDDKNYLLNKISLADKKEVFKTPEHTGDAVLMYHDFDKNSVTDIFVIGENGLEIFDAGGMKLAEQKFNESISPSQASFYKNDSRTFICVLDFKNSALLIWNSENKSMKKLNASQLPLITDLFNDGKLYAVISYGKNIRSVKL